MPQADSHQTYLDAAIEAAKLAGDVIARNFSRPKLVTHKGAVDLVTETDKECEQLIMQLLKMKFPDHRFIGEEETAAAGCTPELTGHPTWMIDPLDGTTNFVHGFPFVCVSIGLAIDKEVVVGVVYNPVLNELFSAAKGGGAFLNHDKIQASATDKIGNAVFGTELGYIRDADTVAAVFDRIRSLTSCSRSIRCGGSCALGLCSVACGRLDAFYEIGFGGCWDCAAGSIILNEAGGKVLDPSGKPFAVMSRRVLGTNGFLAEDISAVLAKTLESPAEPAAPH